jgi:hypothetical protein
MTTGNIDIFQKTTEELNIISTMWKDDILLLSKQCNVEVRDTWKQIVLHLPYFLQYLNIEHFKNFKASNLPSEFRYIIRERLLKISESRKLLIEKSKSQPLLSGRFTINSHNNTITDGEKTFEFYFSPVEREIGEIIESNIHYLQSISHNQLFRLGLFLSGAEWPFAYLSASEFDRVYKIQALEKAFKAPIFSHKCINISRIVGFGHLPKTSISLLIKRSSRKFKENRYDFMITAVNKILGFDGRSILASGFHCFATCPVSYGYDQNGFYITRRNGQKIISNYPMPPNYLYVRPLWKNKSILKNIPIVNISESEHSLESTRRKYDASLYQSRIQGQKPFEEELEKVRNELEHAWDELTRYHRTDFSANDPISKGQCGVTSVYIAKIFNKYDVRFCEGDAIFSDRSNSIFNHCWVKIIKFCDGMENLIIDLTADQSGHNESVICESDINLRKRGIFYNAVREVNPMDEVKRTRSLSERLEILSKRITNISKY